VGVNLEARAIVTDDVPELETALQRTEQAADACRKAVAGLLTIVKQLTEAARVGDLKAITRSRQKAEQARSDVMARLRDVDTVAPRNEETYLADQRYIAELLQFAARSGLRVIRQGDRLYAPPHEVKVSAGDRVVMFGRTRLEKLRPSVLVGELKRVQSKPARSKADDFFNALHEAYEYAAAKSIGAEQRRNVPLVELYELLTLLPGSPREYSLDDFARDVYELDRSGVAQSKKSKGATLQFVGSSGTRLAKVLTVMTEEGLEQKYYAVSFVKD
jgi:hypothetical protein